MRRVLRFTLLGLVVVVATSCGGVEKKPQTLDGWATSMCSRLVEFRNAMLGASEQVARVRPTPDSARSRILAEFSRVKLSTMQLVADINALELPDTKSQAVAAKKLREAGVEQLTRRITIEEGAMAKLPRVLTATRVSRLVEGLELLMVTQAFHATVVVEGAPFIGSEELQQALADSDECDRLAEDS